LSETVAPIWDRIQALSDPVKYMLQKRRSRSWYSPAPLTRKLYSGSLVLDLRFLSQTGWRDFSVQQFRHVLKQTLVVKDVKHPTATILTARAIPGEASLLVEISEN
jgi:protein-disulfide isomerase-like protein with CxxC motif